MGATSVRWSTAGFNAAGTGNFQPVRFTIADLAILGLGRTVEETITTVQGPVDHGSSIDPTLAVDEQFSRWGIAAPPLPAALPQALDRIDLSTVAEQALSVARFLCEEEAMSALDDLTATIVAGLPGNTSELASRTEKAIDGLFGERYRATSHRARRVVLMAGDQNVPFAGLLHLESPSSGVYGGMSLIWFPIAADDAGPACSLLTFVCGTRGLSPGRASWDGPATHGTSGH